MKKIIYISFVFALFAQGASLNEIYQWYQSQQYSKICSNEVSTKDYYRFNSDENFINIYALSCLKTDMISRLTVPIMQLKKTMQSRSNSLYFLTILYQKKFLIHALSDNVTNIPKDLPKTEYILSKIYTKYANKEYKKDKNIYLITFEDEPDITYRLYIKKRKKVVKLYIQTTKNNQVLKTRVYW